ncbi:MAG TPA: phage shock protein A [Microscillaceae bacterium]|nr:phage shock protein A [Microscillaceae bacterium]
MGIFGRISDIFKANINDALDKAEDPAKMIKLMVVEMQESISKATSGLATAMAQEKKLERDYKKHAQSAQQWEQKAMQALSAGNEDLARKALAKKADADGQANQYKVMYEQAATTTGKLKSQVDMLKSKLNEAKMKESTLLARQESAKAQKQIAKQVGSLDFSSSFAKFDKFEEKILKQEAEAQAFTELSEGDTSLNDDFKMLEQNSAVDDDLARLRAKMNQGG